MTDKEAMIKAINVAVRNETPYGCCIVSTSTGAFILAANSTKKDGKTAHAEMNGLRRISELKDSRESDLILYSTAEPCPMCMSAIIWCGIKHVNYGVDISTIANYHKQINISAEEVARQSWLEVKIESGLMFEDCKELFDKF